MAHLPKTIKRTSTQYRKGEKGTLPCWRNLADTTWTESLGSTSPVLLCRYHTPCDRTWCDVMWTTLHLFSKSRDPSLTWENTREMQIEGHSTKQGFPGRSSVKNPLTMQETQVQSLGHEDPVEEEVVSHTSILAWRIPQIQEPGAGYSPWGRRVRHNWATEQARCKITYKYSSNTSSLWKARKD